MTVTLCDKYMLEGREWANAKSCWIIGKCGVVEGEPMRRMT